MPTHIRFEVFIFTVTRFIFHSMYRMVYPFLAVFGRGLGVELSAISLAVSARSLMGALGPFLAFAASRTGHRTGILGGVLIFTLGASLVVFWPVYPVFFASLLLTSLGIYLFLPTMQAFLGEQVNYRQRGRTMAVTELSWSLSFIIGVPLIGFLISRNGWAAPFPVLAILGLFAFGLLVWRLPKTTKTPDGTVGLWKKFQMVINLPSARSGFALSLLLTAAVGVVSLIFGVWLEDSFQLQVAALGGTAAVIGFSELGGEVISGGIVDRLGKERSIAAGLILNSLAVLLLPILGKTISGALLALFLFFLTFEFTIVSVIPLITAIYPELRVNLLSINVAMYSIGHGLGALISTPLYNAGGILMCALAATIFDLLALFFLRQIVIKE